MEAMMTGCGIAAGSGSCDDLDALATEEALRKFTSGAIGSCGSRLYDMVRQNFRSVPIPSEVEAAINCLDNWTRTAAEEETKSRKAEAEKRKAARAEEGRIAEEANDGFASALIEMHFMSTFLKAGFSKADATIRASDGTETMMQMIRRRPAGCGLQDVLASIIR